MRSRKNNKTRRVLASRDVQKFTEECLQQHVPLQEILVPWTTT